MFKSLKSKIVSSIVISGTVLIVLIYTSLYYINIQKSKEFNIHKIEIFFKVLSSEKNLLKIDHLLKEYVKTDPFVKEIEFKYKNINKNYQGKDNSEKILFSISKNFNNKDFNIVYGFNASNEYVDTLKLRMGVVALGFYLLVFLIARFISSLLTPFNEIVNFFENYSTKHNLLVFKEKNVASEFLYVQKSLNNVIRESTRYKKKIEQLAYFDKVSGLKNRAKFQEDLYKMKGSDFYLLFLDLDGFKLVNDTLGHDAGDQVLKEIGKRLSFIEKEFQGNVYRLGGDEFVILIQKNNLNIKEILKKIQFEIAADLFLFEEIVNVYASIGVTVVNNYLGKRDILLEADIAMYEAKFAGKNQYKFFEEKMRKKLENKLKVIHDIKLASLNKDFVFYYQPKVLKNGEIYGVEALIRWKKDNEILTPFFFIEQLESSKYIIPVGYYLIKEVFELSKQYPNIVFSINLSEKQILDSYFLKAIFRLIKETGVNVSQIEFEITERWNSIDSDIVYQRLKSLKSAGFNLSIDDFGEDRSSFKRTDILPISCLKIDKSFVDRLNSNSISSINSLKAIKEYARLSNIELVVEGVENKKEIEILSNIGINKFQGYYFYKPMPKNEIISLLN